MMGMKKIIRLILVLIILGQLFNCSNSDKNSSESTKVDANTIICDEFDVVWELKGKLLLISLSTDLPDYTDVMVSVSRNYLEVGNSANYSIDYYSTKGKVSEYRTNISVLIDDIMWEENLRAFQRKMAGLGIGFEVATISEDIEISFIVPMNQSSSLFGEDNKNLGGKTVSSTGSKVIREKVIVSKELGREYSGGSSISTAPSSLKVGIVYSISKKIPLMPELEPSNPELALRKIIDLLPGTAITILKSSEKNNTKWYYVQAKSQNGEIGSGWINSTALYGQTLEVIK